MNRFLLLYTLVVILLLSSSRALAEQSTVPMKFYSASWCSACAEVEDFLDSKKISYEKIDIDTDKNAEKIVRSFLDGQLSLPVLVGCNNNFVIGFLPNKIQELLDKCQ